MRKHILLLILTVILAIQGFPQGKWEVGIHYSRWSINVAKSFIEDNFTDAFENFDPDKGALDFDSNGNNYGIEVRFFPGGKNGAFSIGLSYERNNFKGTLSGSYEEQDNFGNRAVVTGDGSFEMNPHSFNFSLRWDLFPAARLHPYIGLGFGIGPLDGTLFMKTTTTTYIGGQTLTDIEYEELSLKEAIEEIEQDEGEDFPVNFFPIVYLHLGIRGEIVPNIYLMGEVAIYDGIIFRGGLALRF